MECVVKFSCSSNNPINDCANLANTMKIKPSHHLFFLILGTLPFFLSACKVPGPSLQTTDVPVAIPLPTESATPLPSPTETTTQTYTPSPTAENTSTATITPTPTPTPFFGFENAWIYESYADYSGTTFTFVVPGVGSPYFGTVDGYDLTCEPDPNLDDRLNCRSEQNLFGSNLKAFEFFADSDLSFLVHAGTFATYLVYAPTTPTQDGLIWPRAIFTQSDIYWGTTPPGCTTRGVDLTCEIEYRRYDDGSCLVGMSCFDSCGYYYSVDTIKDKSGEWIGTGPCW